MEKYLSVTTLDLKWNLTYFWVCLINLSFQLRKRPTLPIFLQKMTTVIQATIWSGIYHKLGSTWKIWRLMWRACAGSWTERRLIIIEKLSLMGLGGAGDQFEQPKKEETDRRRPVSRTLQATSSPVFKRIDVNPVAAEPLFEILSRPSAGVFLVLDILPHPRQGSVMELLRKLPWNIVRANQREDIDVLTIGRGGAPSRLGRPKKLWYELF